MIPTPYLSKMVVHNLEIEGVSVEVYVVDRAAFVHTYIAQFKSLISQMRFVALDIKMSEDLACLFILCVGNQCLVIQLAYLDQFPSSLKEFLADETICFVSTRMSDIRSYLLERMSIIDVNRTQRIFGAMKSGVELGHLAARILKKPLLMKENELGELAPITGIKMERSAPLNTDPIWHSRVFSDEMIKLAIEDVYETYLIGKNLMDLIKASEKPKRPPPPTSNIVDEDFRIQ